MPQAKIPENRHSSGETLIRNDILDAMDSLAQAAEKAIGTLVTIKESGEFKELPFWIQQRLEEILRQLVHEKAGENHLVHPMASYFIWVCPGCGFSNQSAIRNYMSLPLTCTTCGYMTRNLKLLTPSLEEKKEKK